MAGAALAPRPARASHVWAAVALYVIAVLASVALPFAVGPLGVNLLLRCGSIVILGISWNLAANAGLISLGHSAFWGLGSYAAMLVANRLGLPFFVSLVPAATAGALLGVGLALVTGRLRGIYFAIATLAMSEGLRVIAVMLPDMTGGSAGVFINQSLRPDARLVAIVTLAGAVACALLAHLLSRTPFHYACRAMRNNEHAAQMLGINPLRFRTAVLAVSGAIAAFAGGVNIWYGGFLDPNIGFDLHITILAQIGPILGGIHTLAGPIIGGIAALAVSEASRVTVGEQGYSLLVYGAILVVSIMFMPHGIRGALRDMRARPAARRSAMRADQIAS
jgi:branched-chain amino acid transport system permease protein